MRHLVNASIVLFVALAFLLVSACASTQDILKPRYVPKPPTDKHGWTSRHICIHSYPTCTGYNGQSIT